MDKVTQEDRELFQKLEKLVFNTPKGAILDGESLYVIAAHRLSAYAPDRITPEVVEAAARAMCLEDGRMGDTEAVELQRVEHEWREYVPAATAVLLAAFATLGGA